MPTLPASPVCSRRQRLDRCNLLLTLPLFGLLVLLATLGRHWGWIYSLSGGLLVVVRLYYLMGSAFRAPAAWLVSVAFAIGALLELSQYLVAQLYRQFSSSMLHTVFGSTANGSDLLVYALGALLAWRLEHRHWSAVRLLQDIRRYLKETRRLAAGGRAMVKDQRE